MRYRINKTAIIGLPYYFAFLLLLMPYKFNKNNPGSPFQLSRGRVVLATISFTAVIVFFLYKGYYIVTLWNITCIYYFAMLYSRYKIMTCLNSMYALLQTTKYQHSVLFPLLLIFSSFLLHVAIGVPINVIIYKLGVQNLSVQVMYFLNFSLETTFNSLCFATALVFRDIGLQMRALEKIPVSKESISRLVHTQWMAYRQVELISQAFSPYLFNYITVGMSVIMYINIYYRKMIQHVTLYFPLVLGTWSLSLMCYCSHLIDYEADKLLLEIQGLIHKNRSPEAYRLLVVMMEQARLRLLHISVQGCFKLHLPLLLSLANIFVTYMVVLLGFT